MRRCEPAVDVIALPQGASQRFGIDKQRPPTSRLIIAVAID